MITFSEITNEHDLHILASKADEVWHEYFIGLLSKEQVDYMVDKFQSYDSMSLQIHDNGYQYYFIMDDSEILGYIGIHKEPSRMFLSKLYLMKENRGHGYASMAFDFLCDICKKNGLKSIYLTVNKYNEHSILVYKAKGFSIVDSCVTDIGQGFVMDDYIMEKFL